PNAPTGQVGIVAGGVITEATVLANAKSNIASLKAELADHQGAVESKASLLKPGELVLASKHAATVKKQQELKLQGYDVPYTAVQRELMKCVLYRMEVRITADALTAGLRQWKAATRACRFQVIYDAAAVIRRAAQRYLSALEIRTRKELRARQAQVQLDRLEDLVLRRQKAAVTVQSVLRIAPARRLADARRGEWDAACCLQRAVRVRSARRWLKGMKKERARQMWGAGHIQRWMLGHHTRVKVKLSIMLGRLERREWCREEELRVRKEKFMAQGAARTIQGQWRTRQLMRSLRMFVKLSKRRCAIKIQTQVRRWLAIKERSRLQEAFNFKYQKEIRAALMVQTRGRVLLAKKRVENIRFENDKAQLVSRMHAEYALRERLVKLPVLIPTEDKPTGLIRYEAGQAMYLDLVELTVRINRFRSKLNPFHKKKELKSAVLIQRVFRGWRKRKQAKRKMAAAKGAARAKRRAELLKSTLLLQSSYRGCIARKEARKRKYGAKATMIQRIIRGFNGRMHAKHRHESIIAATVIQKRARGIRARALCARYRHESITLVAPARVIQKMVKRRKAWLSYRSFLSAQRRDCELRLAAHAAQALHINRAKLLLIVKGAACEDATGDSLLQYIMRSLGGQVKNEYRIEGAKFVKMLKDAPNLFSSSFNATDADLIFAKAKTVGERSIGYKQFIGALDVVAASLFPQVKRFENRKQFKARPSRLLSLVTAILKTNTLFGNDMRQFCKDSTDRFVHAMCACIQGRVRGLIGRRVAREWMQRLRNLKEMERLNAAAVVLQASVRQVQGHRKVVAVARHVIEKFVDPGTNRPYWSNPRTGRVVWDKPKVLGQLDTHRYTQIATKKTEHVVLCSGCDEEVVTRLCMDCSDSFCQNCYDNVHTRGNRAEHYSKAIHPCIICGYQQSTRLCEHCSSRSGRTHAYCDVCFFNEHPWQDPLREDSAGTGTPHAWSPLVVMCIECKRYAARWLCKTCDDVFCTGCFTRLHRHGTMSTHPVEKLPYYTRDMHMQYEMDTKLLKHLEAAHEAKLRRKQELEQQKVRAACTIQAAWRGMVGRVEGKKILKSGRRKMRCDWHQRKKDDAEYRSHVLYKLEDALGVATALKSDTLEEMLLKGLPRWKRAKARSDINNNREDILWFHKDEAKKLKRQTRRGFEIGTKEELQDQVKSLGVRLPGTHTLKEGYRSITTSCDLSGIVKPKSYVRLGGESTVMKVNSVTDTRIVMDRVWRGADYEGTALVYCMRFGTKEKLKFRARRLALTNQVSQYAIDFVLIVEELLVNGLDKAQAKAKQQHSTWLYSKVKRHLKKHRRRVHRLNMLLNENQSGLETPVKKEEKPDREEEKRQKQEGTYLGGGNIGQWMEKMDDVTGRPYWQHVDTG
ncbi:unnamed protein product, partial [Chrysoparadoxa australica]